MDPSSRTSGETTSSKGADDTSATRPTKKTKTVIQTDTEMEETMMDSSLPQLFSTTTNLLPQSGDSGLPPSDPKITSSVIIKTSVGKSAETVPIDDQNQYMEPQMDREPLNLDQDSTYPSQDGHGKPQTLESKEILPTTSYDMDINSNATIQDSPKISYSKALKKNIPKYKDEKSLTWANSVAQALANLRKVEFDCKAWHNDRIIEAFKNPDLLDQFLEHKVKTCPTKHNIPQAISQKFKHMDTAFFRSFSRTKETQPPHQKEFNTLFQMATEKYKRLHNATFINKTNRDQIFSKLKTKLALDFICNIDFLLTSPHDSTRFIFYALNFAKINCTQDFDDVRKQIDAAHQAQLSPLPASPNEIPKEIMNLMPFSLPITDRKLTRATVLGLRKVFRFGKLPNNYFENPLEELPDNPEQLRAEVKDLFPITDRSRLPFLAEYRKKLMKFYDVERMPSLYFNLPPAKPKLPSTPQELNSAIRAWFPCNPVDDTDFRHYIEILREHYSFRRVPTDYFIQKKPLPVDPIQVKVEGTYSFPITDTSKAKEFLAEIHANYKYTIPLPIQYMTANPTEKPNLPEEHENVTLVNITVPITSPKQLVDTARDLREFYFFRQIPESWIEIIPGANAEPGVPKLPATVEEIMSHLEHKDKPPSLALPITEQSEVERTVGFLKEHFNFKGIPAHIINTPDLPEPQWDIFSNYAPQQ